MAPSMASLLIISGTSSGDYYLLKGKAVVIGRDDGCPIQIVDEAVSRRHLRIRHDRHDHQDHQDADGDSYVAEDLDSANGTSVNDERLDHERPLADGDILRIGSTEIMFSAIDFADRETAFQHYRRRGEGDKSTIIRRPL